MAGVSCLAFFFDVSAAFESIGTDRVPIFDRPVSGRETLSQLVFVLALHFVQHLDGSPPGHGQPVQTHCCSLLQPQRWPTSAHVMSRPGSDDSPGSSPLAAPVSGRETLSQLVFVLALHFVQHLPPSLPFSVLALSLLRISIIPDPTGSPWMPMTVRGCVPSCMYLDNEKCVYGILLRRISCFRVERHG